MFGAVTHWACPLSQTVGADRMFSVGGSVGGESGNPLLGNFQPSVLDFGPTVADETMPDIFVGEIHFFGITSAGRILSWSGANTNANGELGRTGGSFATPAVATVVANSLNGQRLVAIAPTGAGTAIRTVYVTATRILVIGYYNGNTYTASPFQIAVTLNTGESLLQVVGVGLSMAVLTSHGRILSWATDSTCNIQLYCHIGRSYTGSTVSGPLQHHACRLLVLNAVLQTPTAVSVTLNANEWFIQVGLSTSFLVGLTNWGRVVHWVRNGNGVIDGSIPPENGLAAGDQIVRIAVGGYVIFGLTGAGMLLRAC